MSLDLEALEAQPLLDGPGWAPHIRALIAELRASRKVVEAARQVGAWWNQGPAPTAEMTAALAEYDSLVNAMRQEEAK